MVKGENSPRTCMKERENRSLCFGLATANSSATFLPQREQHVRSARSLCMIFQRRPFGLRYEACTLAIDRSRILMDLQ